MPFRELKGLKRETYLGEQTRQLRLVYMAVQRRLVNEIRDVDVTKFGAARANALLKEVNVLKTALDVKAAKWTKEALPLAYDRGLDLASERIKALKVSRFVNYDAKIHTSAVSILVDEVTVDLLTANNTLRNTITRFIRQTQQEALKDSEISRMIAEGIAGGQTRREVSKTLLKELRNNLEEGKFLSIKGRSYRADAYAELVARTRTREATTKGVVNTAVYYGMDLVQWDAHSEPCEECQQYSGRVYSISGENPDFPFLDSEPPVHPNCQCVIVPVTEDHLKASEDYDSLVKLSNSPSVPVDSFQELQKQLETI